MIGSYSREEREKMAKDLFNLVWRYLEKPQRTAEENDLMIHAAHASRFHWGEVGSVDNLAIGEWQISHVYAVLGRAEPALYHGSRALEICKRADVKDFPLAYAYEALARANALEGNMDEARRCIALGKATGRRIKDSMDRDLFLKDLGSVPGYSEVP
jgi:hypothetical protein